METGKVRFVYRHLAVIGRESVRAAEATECAAEQGRFWDYHDILFKNWSGENQSAFSDANLKGFARALGLDAASFNSCLDSGRHADRVQRDIQDARLLGVRYTPTVFVNEQRLEGLHDYEDYQRTIERELAKIR